MATTQTRRGSFPRELNEPEVEVASLTDSPWSVRVLAFASPPASGSQGSPYPEISVNVCFGSTVWSVCTEDLSLPSRTTKKDVPWSATKAKILGLVRARLDQSQASYDPDELHERVSAALDEGRKYAFLRAVRAQARQYLEVITSEDAVTVWQEEEINRILEQ